MLPTLARMTKNVLRLCSEQNQTVGRFSLYVVLSLLRILYIAGAV
jgi:hypothetical protein